MATTFKRLGAGNLATANDIVTAYTVPLLCKAIIKSFIISNGSASTVSVTVRFASTAIMYTYVMKPNDTILVPAMDQLLIAQSSITISANAGNSISYYISGIEALVTDPEYSYVVRLGLGTIPVSSGTIVNANSSIDRIVKGIVLCNTYASDAKVSIEVFGRSILQAITVKTLETILVPTSDLFIPSTEYMTASASSGGVHYYITGKEL
ncbi:hypothetical protein [Paenibacillus sp. O199]|uniref:hypothetical protein n=1 Tax=Paenibacillus sp. O199 TaxID=1643925 RepID=UPI0007BF1199|nr:hypothetical protein [Paenibacillus sp. O199]